MLNLHKVVNTVSQAVQRVSNSNQTAARVRQPQTQARTNPTINTSHRNPSASLRDADTAMSFVVSRLASNNAQPSAQVLAHNLGRAAGSVIPSGAPDNAAKAKESFLSRLVEKIVIGAAKGGISGSFKLAQKSLEDHRDIVRNRSGNPDSSRVARENDIKYARRLQREAEIARKASKVLGKVSKGIDAYNIGKDVVNGKTEDAISKTIGTAAGTATTAGCTGALTSAEGASVVGAPLIPVTVIGCSALGAGVGTVTTEVAKPVVRWGGNAIEDVADWSKNTASDSANWTSNAARDTAEWTGNAAKNTVNFVGDILP